MTGLGVVVIGRNEGERLRRCLRSVVSEVDRVVYVDSGSTDGSAALAASLGVDVVELDASRPFTAARARNEGAKALQRLAPATRYVQFVDGDCEVVEGWLSRARQSLDENPGWGVVCGRRREYRPEASCFNRLCDMEWDTPVGEARACGGDAMMRHIAFEEAGGFRSDMIAGEEPELCVRIRRAGWTIHRIDAEMTRHDAAMLRWSQWWRRSERAGHAYAEGAALHGRSPERHNRRALRSAVVWGAWGPLIVVAALVAAIAPAVRPGAAFAVLLAAAAYLILGARVYRHRRRHGDPPKLARLYAFFTLLGKVPESVGALSFHWSRMLRRRRTLIEYKGGPEASA